MSFELYDLPEPIAPISELDFVTILLWYAIFFVFAGGISEYISSLYKNTRTISWVRDPDFSFRSVIMAGPLEEMTFRGIPVALWYMLDLSPAMLFLMLMIANGVWAGFHSHKFQVVVYTFIFGLFLSRFWMEGFDGLWWVAVIIHSLHNVFVTLMGSYFKEDRREPQIG